MKAIEEYNKLISEPDFVGNEEAIDKMTEEMIDLRECKMYYIMAIDDRKILCTSSSRDCTM